MSTGLGLPPAMATMLSNYLVERDNQRAESVARKWSALSPREQRLFREAAVMGYVLGVRAVPGSYDVKIPHDREIVASVIDACTANGDLYPTVRRLGSRKKMGGAG